MIARELMAINFLLLALATTWQWFYVSKHPEFSDDLTDSMRRFGMRRDLSLVFVAGVVAVLLLFMEEYAYFFYFLIPVMMYLTTRKLKVVRKADST